MVNINKPGKCKGATYNSTLLNKSLLKRPNLLNNLVGVLTPFRIGRYAAVGDTEQMFHQILVENEDRDVLRFLRRDNFYGEILFGKVDYPCMANWTIKKLQQTNLIPLIKFLSKP